MRKSRAGSLAFAAALLAAGAARGGDFALTISLPKAVYAEEEEVVLSAAAANTAAGPKEFPFAYLQPREKNALFVGKEFLLEVSAGDTEIAAFTNHMPPEPRPGTKPVALDPGAKYEFLVPVPTYYYPLSLPRTFTVRLRFGDAVSNPAVFTVKPSEGTREAGGVFINPGFSEGKDAPYGWKLHDPKIAWDRAGRAVNLALDKPTAEGEGLWVYSVFNPVSVPGRFAAEIGTAPGRSEVIAFIEGWGVVAGRRRRIERIEWFVHPGDLKDGRLSREVSLVNPNVRWVRVRLFTYLNPGTVRFSRFDLRPLP